MRETISLEAHGIHVNPAFRNLSVAELYEAALRDESGSQIAANGALVALSGAKTGRSPTDKRIVKEPTSEADVWWGPVNIAIDKETYATNRERARDYLNICPQLYVVDGYAGWDEHHRIKVRVICARAYHALFMHNMLIRPTPEQLASFGEPDHVIYNAGEQSADPSVEGVTSTTCVALNFASRELVILGTQYAGEMKKGVFTLMHYLMPRDGVLSMHCSCNVGDSDDAALFFGLSGTGKTTLSADADRKLIGDDEHCWTDTGVFNIDLSAENEPEIFQAIRYGAVLENVVYDEETREVDWTSKALTENTRTSYPIEFIANAQIPCVTVHPKNIIFLTCDAFGVLPPVSKLSPEQAMYHFISGYTAKVAGTEVGVTEPEATFSACFGAAFLVWHPTRYAEMLAEKLREHGSQAWLVNTGWIGGAYGTGKRISLKHTRAIIDAIHSGALIDAPTARDDYFNLNVPTACPGVPEEVLSPKAAWADGGAYDETAKKLVGLFRKNFAKYEDSASAALVNAGPVALD